MTRLLSLPRHQGLLGITGTEGNSRHMKDDYSDSEINFSTLS